MAQYVASPTSPSATPRCRITVACDPMAGLRQRKKQRTRNDLVNAALDLFLHQGYGRTTVDEITAAVDVSQRTFFRYFANKEEVALAILAGAEEYFIQCLRSRPAAESPLEALRAAIRETWQRLNTEDGEPISATATLELIQLIESTPTLLAAHLRQLFEQEHLVASIIAEREGVDPATDLRPRVLAAAFAAVLRAAHEAWGVSGLPAGDVGPDGMVTVIDRHLDMLGPALAGDWRTGR
ncbi:TetR/AcrR family transcriptional regulator [Streptomyces sp. NPDC092296]|uniref:TetR/AcrR family transcriptional regulator n=1 Tax=Streptomyces sp. NPDC092296 TaxID=3366012 RepID=UPI003830B563